MLAPWLESISFWVHLATVALLAAGVALTLIRDTPREAGVERLIPFGTTFFAVPMALFGMQHFVFLSAVKDGVPSWMPWHLFWACLVGAGLIAACLSIIADIKAGLAGLMVGIMLFLFVLMIYMPFLVTHLHDRFAITGPFRDLALSGAGLVLAGCLGVGGSSIRLQWLVNVGRCFFAVSMLVFAVDHFLHPQFDPGVPSQDLMPAWLPAHLAWSYGMGAVLLVCGVCILANRGARAAAVWLGVAFLLLVAVIYLPMEIIHPSIEISGELDEVAEKLAMSGAALMIAAALGKKRPRPLYSL
jgi:uncharacterized membrane protein